MAITNFRGEYAFLSNFHNHPLTFDGRTYQNAEAAFQSQKAPTKERRDRYSQFTPNVAKREGRREPLPENWDENSEQIMYEVLKAKFSDPTLKQKLIATGDHTLVEGNTWHDNNWGDCMCNKCVMRPGKNRLGKLLMKLRAELQHE